MCLSVFTSYFDAHACAESHYLKGEKRYDDGHPADRHGDVSPPLLGDDVDGAEEEDRPDDVVEDYKAQEGHQDPQRDTHHLENHIRVRKTDNNTRGAVVQEKRVGASHQPRPVDDPVQLQSDEDELEDVDGTQHLQLRRGRDTEEKNSELHSHKTMTAAEQILYLKRAVVSEPPDAGCYRNRRHEEEGHEDEEPEVVSSRHAVAHQHLEHQQQDVEPHCDQHGLELHTRLPFSPERKHKKVKT